MVVSQRVETLRKLIVDSFAAQSRISPVNHILLSGGLDTSIIADAGSEILRLNTAITVLCGDNATDAYYSKAIAQNHKFTHHILQFDSPLDLVLDASDTLNDTANNLTQMSVFNDITKYFNHAKPTENLLHTVKALSTFDPMDIRNSIVVTASLNHLSKQVSHQIPRPKLTIATGDGADELFAGYAFLHNKTDTELREYLDKMISHMTFSAVPIARGFGFEVYQPFLDRSVVEFSKSCVKDELVNVFVEGNWDNEPLLHGKWILRLAFPEVFSCWRKKDPAEVGSGTTLLPKLFEEFGKKTSNGKGFLDLVEKIWNEFNVKIRDNEHLFYFYAFCLVYPPTKADDGITDFEGCAVKRFGTDNCRSCQFQLQSPQQDFCVVCGEWPARVSNS